MLADTPKNWPNGQSWSTLHVLVIFAGIPLLVILAVSLLVLAPSWVKGPRYRPGQPWEAESELFGAATAARPVSAAGGVTGLLPGVEGDQAVSQPPPLSGRDMGTQREQGSGGASAGW
jgi:hypothetical protein